MARPGLRSLDTENPYRYLFPIGCLSGILGTALWIAFRLGLLELYPAPVHANLMIGSFLLPFALGFLWTAVPRFLRAPPPRQLELGFLCALLLLSPLAGLLPEPALFYAGCLGALLLTLRFGFRSFRRRGNSPPPSFVFVGAGLLLATLSLAVLLASRFLELPEAIPLLARNFFLKGFLLCLVLGIGIRLLPALLGWAPLPTEQPPERSFHFDFSLLPLLALLLVALALESFGHVPQAGLSYAAALSITGYTRMGLGRFPASRTALGWSIWLSGNLICLSPLSLFLEPAFSVHFWHSIFISGFGLMSLFVSMRVILAHSGHDYSSWEGRRGFYLISALVLLAMLARISTPWLKPEHGLNHYAYASGLWILALLAWAYCFFRFTPFRRGSAAPADETPSRAC